MVNGEPLKISLLFENVTIVVGPEAEFISNNTPYALIVERGQTDAPPFIIEENVTFEDMVSSYENSGLETVPPGYIRLYIIDD